MANIQLDLFPMSYYNTLGFDNENLLIILILVAPHQALPAAFS
ncbi:hypothetical protein SAMN05660649_00893 [Desulfotomaculum arcticum]|uniref:Uncharacterized protein n=1 Tax=Desulfotruncus arcticus DSM 17038 TaxID=1121424 RepID=A0A1I2PNS0_9FIRM|nr:hypothetical protein SAMN05660649_00893 [Desulfotomaculum arcticum] [Desulfotruncus arcticus DSM 17038]